MADTPAAASSSSSQQKRLSITNPFKGVFSSPVAQEINKGFHQAVQYAGEKLGTAEVTPLPQEFLELEVRVDRLRTLHENLIKIAAMQVTPGTATDLKFSVYSTLNNVVDAVGQTPETVNTVNEKLRSVSINNHTSNQALADEFVNAAVAVGDDSPLGVALLKSAEAQRKIGKARTQMNTEINDRFIKRLTKHLETTIRSANASRRNVYSFRVKLDALKARVRSSSPEKADALNDELQLTQSEFNSLVTLAIDLMKGALANIEPLAALADMMASMLTYFQTGFELLSELAPELDSIKVSQEQTDGNQELDS